jgi:hypothetical protein
MIRSNAALKEAPRPEETCLECGAAKIGKYRHAVFCGASCRMVWNTRRSRRGAELYDLFMAFRFERETARALNLQSALNRLASVFRAEDADERLNRKSWQAPAAVLERRPYLIVKRGRV